MLRTDISVGMVHFGNALQAFIRVKLHKNLRDFAALSGDGLSTSTLNEAFGKQSHAALQPKTLEKIAKGSGYENRVGDFVLMIQAEGEGFISEFERAHPGRLNATKPMRAAARRNLKATGPKIKK